MKKAVAVGVFALLMCTAGYAVAVDNTFADGGFKFSMNYPESWKSETETPGVEVSKSIFGFKVGTKIDASKISDKVPSMVNACFAEKKCSPGDMKKGPEMHLMMMDLAAMSKMGKGESDSKRDKKGSSPSDMAEERDDCKLISRTSTRWAGRKATDMVMCCPDGKKKWRCTEYLSMQRNVGKAKNMYNLMCTVQEKGKNDEDARQKALAKFNGEMKPVCDKARTSSKFLK